VLRRIVGPNRKEVTEEWRILHIELHNLCTSPNIVREIKSRRMRWAGHIAHMVEMRNVYTILVRKPEWKRSLQTTRQNMNNIKSILKKEIMRVWTGFTWLTIESSGGLL
jgi:hypothetical protein